MLNLVGLGSRRAQTRVGLRGRSAIIPDGHRAVRGETPQPRDEVADAVRENASFQGEDGKFSKKVYLDALKYNNLTPQAYEKSLKEDLVAEKFRNMVKDSVAVTDADVRAFYMDQMKATGSPVDEKAFAENMENYRRSLESMDQDKTFKSVIAGLKANCKIEKYILQEPTPFTS